MAENCVSHMPRATVCPCRCRKSDRRRKAFSFRCVFECLFLRRTQLSSGGEFSSLHQNNFHHYRDFWEFDISTHSWERIDTKVRPSARSGHRWVRFTPIIHLFYYAYRMAMWKHYIVLFGGFIDPGFTSALRSLMFTRLCATCNNYSYSKIPK